MKTGIQLLQDFISDFSLECGGGIVCFDARIEFSSNDLFKQIDTEVHMITIQPAGLSVFYLLNPEIATDHLPDFFPYEDQHFVYLKDQFLMIQWRDRFCKCYIIKIFPGSAKTLQW